jgi:Leucine-rich repeat (LRR) protein
LKTLKLSKNNITKLPHLNPRCLISVHLSNNKITDCTEFKGHETITLLELRKNQLTSCDGIHKMPKLEALYLSENKIEAISQLKGLT